MDGPYKCSGCGYEISEFDNPWEHHKNCAWRFTDQYGNLMRYDMRLVQQGEPEEQ